MTYTIRPLTPDLWSELENLFGNTGPVSRCWCMYWRIGAEYRQRPAETNKAAFREVVKSKAPVGLLAFDGDLAVGWCQVTPRDALPYLEHSWKLEDDEPIWSISCFYIRKGYRKKGVTSALITAAIEAAKKAGAAAVEAYPLDGDLSPSSTSTGYVTTFKRAGFKIVDHHAPPRPIMRYTF